MTIRIAAPLALALAATTALAEEADFDSFPSGFLGTSFVDGGITFSENQWFPGSALVQFAATNGTGSLGGDPAFSAPNVMTTGGWSTGTALGYIRTHQWIATTGQMANVARVDVWWITGAEWEGCEVSLEGLVGGDVVASDTFVHPGAAPAPVEHTRMELSGADFERIRFICRGGPPTGDKDGILAVFDNVVIESGGGCYADCDGSGELDFFDFLCFQNAFAAGEPYADCDRSGDLDFFDFLCFQNEFAAGCP